MHRFATTVSRNLGVAGENLFSACLRASTMDWKPASARSDNTDHIDFHIMNEKTLRRDGWNITNVDVKGLKRLRASPLFHPQSTLLHMEIEAAGAPDTRSGWLYNGKAQYIAFQLHPSTTSLFKKRIGVDEASMDGCFLMVERKFLRDFVDQRVAFDVAVSQADKAVYTKYTRYSQGEHRGSISLVPLEDIVQNIQRLVVLTSHGKLIYL